MHTALWVLLIAVGSCGGDVAGLPGAARPGEGGVQRCDCRRGAQPNGDRIECHVADHGRRQAFPNFYYRRPYNYRQTFDYPWSQARSPSLDVSSVRWPR